MKKYNVQNYVRYKKEVEKLSRKLENKDWSFQLHNKHQVAWI